MANNKAATPAPCGIPANVSGPAFTGLSDKLNEPKDDSSITRWDGKANPVPPQVNKSYWERVYNRADSMLYIKAKKEVKEDAIRAKFKMSTAATADAIKTRQEISRDIDETWDMALQVMIHDILAADDELPATAPKEKRRKRAALRQTREHLTDEFFDFMNRFDKRAVTPRRLVDPAELAAGLQNPIWYGDGDWVTMMPL
ncbi:hypothetical protein B0T14DRAFT_597172 [Immersiella caudata]|uniref:Uncharacterized protein n=1 Tax=Immersiella caudata TaxID=314043 RepID=A0AA39XD75_9PEZI|nr:hypothetical protein B0T14DRAFT_597172 [Immersiella caudata]